MPVEVVNSKNFVEWAKGHIGANSLVILSDDHSADESRYTVYKGVVNGSKPGVLFMEVPYNHSNSLKDLKDFWTNKGHQKRMVEVVEKAHNNKWQIRNIDADMSTGQASMPESNWVTTGLRFGPERQKFMATNLRKGMKSVGQNKGGLLIVGKDHITGKKMVGVTTPSYVEALTFNSYAETERKKVVFGKKSLMGYALSRSDMFG